jgi:putative copper export protein
VTGWEIVRFLHLVAMAFFVGGQLMLVAVAVVTPAVRRHGSDEAMRAAARRFGIGSVIALVVLIATGAAMASHFARWDDPALQAKLALLVLVFVLIGLHVATPYMRAVSIGTLVVSLLIVWFGVKLVYG